MLLVCSCETGNFEQRELVEFVPENVDLVLKISNPQGLLADLKNNDLLSAPEATLPFQYFSDRSQLLQNVNAASESLMCIRSTSDSTSAYAFITRYSEALFVPDSIQNKVVETLTYDKKTIQRVTINDQVEYTAVVDSVFVASSSQQVLEEILDGATETDSTFQKIYGVKTGNDLTALVKQGDVIENDSVETSFTTWTALEANLLPDGVTATGVTLATDTVTQVLDLFEGQIPQQNEVTKVIPTNAQSALAFTFSDPELLEENFRKFHGTTGGEIAVHPLFESVNEIGVIRSKNGNTIVLKSIDPSITEEALGVYTEESGVFRDINIRSFSEPDLFSLAFSPLVQNVKPTLVGTLDDFFIFSENQDTLEWIIAAYQNNAVLEKASFYMDAASQLSNASSLVYYTLKEGFGEPMTHFFGERGKERKTSSEKYPLAVLQFSYDRNFAHVNLVSKEVSENEVTTGNVAQRFSIELESELMSDPQFFSNHRTQGKDIVVQDMNNTLYFISSGGKILWTKKLKSPILGKIQEVDLLRNGRKQLAFNTSNALFIVDRNGKEVSPFPLTFRDEVTQPLSVFDYDNNRKYRFVVVQGKDILMYDSKAKIVKGFTFTKTESDIVLPPQHIRMGNKDYLLVAEDSGKLNILSRVGKIRVPVSRKFEFTDIPIAREGSSFVVITKTGTKESISQSGKVTSQVLNVSDSYSFVIRGNTKATMDDNLLRVNGKLADLPYGIYTEPRIVIENRKTYISVTETQEKKAFVFDRLGNLLPGFPVYGGSLGDVADVRKEGRRYLVVKGTGKEIVLYSF